MKKIDSDLKKILLLVVCLILAGCGGSQVLANVTAVLDGIAALQGVLPTAGVSPELAKQIGDYATAAAAGTAKCAADLAAGGETAILVAKCGQDLAAAVKPTLPPGTPQNIVGLVDTIYGEIQVVYAAIEANSTGASSGTGAKKAALAVPARWQPTGRDASKLRALAARAGKLAKS